MSLSNLPYSPGVYKDANGDGYPDGPLQIEAGGSGTNDASRAKINGYGQVSERVFDVVYFPDNLAHLNYRLSREKAALGTAFRDDREAGMFISGLHNRGSYGVQAWGIPYWLTGGPLLRHCSKDVGENEMAVEKQV